MDGEAGGGTRLELSGWWSVNRESEADLPVESRVPVVYTRSETAFEKKNIEDEGLP